MISQSTEYYQKRGYSKAPDANGQWVHGTSYAYYGGDVVFWDAPSRTWISGPILVQSWLFDD